MKVGLAQINTTVGDFAGNLQRIVASLDEARSRGLDLVVFPEQAIPGYPAEDLLERDDFLGAVDDTFRQAVEASRGTAMVLGTVMRARSGGGNPIHNSAALVVDGQVVSVQHKTLLPTYDVFDEGRYFRPAAEYHVVPFRGRKLGLLICEDLWNDPAFWPERRYPVDPVEGLIAAGPPDLMVAISASPFSLGRPRFRYRMLRNTVLRHGVELLYCNLVGGNTTLVFEGASLALDPEGRVRALGPAFEEALVEVDLDQEAPERLPAALQGWEAADQGAGEGEAGQRDASDVADAWHGLVLGTRDYLRKTGFRGAVVGLSGGIDSALTAAVAVEALGAGNVRGVAMPSRYSSETSVRDARDLAAHLGIRLDEVAIEPAFRAFRDMLRPVLSDGEHDVTEENIQARCRGIILMALSNKTGALLLTTGNKSELAVGYCTLYGDMSGGLAVLSDCPKLLVYRIARWLNRERELIPSSTIEKAPSAELRPGQRDEDTLPPYSVLDPILEAYIEDRRSLEEIAALGFERSLVDRVVRLVDRNEYKRKQAAPGIRITAKAFGPGRRFPIVQRFRS